MEPGSFELKGLIDLGEAFISHAAFGLRQPGAFEGRKAMLGGYTEAQPVSDEFLAVWWAVMILTEMSALPALTPARLLESGAALQELVDG